MKNLLVPALLFSLAAQGALAQADNSKPAKTDPRATVPLYTAPYVKKQAQLDAMTPRADNIKNAYGANTALSPNATGRYLPPSVRISSSSNGEKHKLPRIEQPARKTRAKASDELYGTDQWSTEQTYKDPNTASPYGVR